VNGFVVAVTFLTRVPTGVRIEGGRDLARSVPWLPVVGACIGAVLGAVYALSVELWPLPVAAALTLVAGLLLTGAFHEDGLADSADALGGGWDREQALRIARDPTHGSYGVLAIVASFALRLLALAALPAREGFVTLVVAHCLSRAIAVAVLGIQPAATPGGLGASYARASTRAGVAVGSVVGLAVAGAGIGLWALVALALALPIVVFVVSLARRKLGGISGDVLGAVQQIVEVAVLLVAAAVVAGEGKLIPWI